MVLGYKQHIVPCDHSTPYCECPELVDSVKVDVCVFVFEINVYQTFTSYNIDPVTNKIAVPHGGRAWYIDEATGELKPYPDSRTTCETLSPPGGVACTHPYTVDGYSYRTYYSVNGRIPGPTLIVQYNQTVVVNVTNAIDSESVSLHWHGMHQYQSNWMDGVQHVTQCGINAGTTFTYIFQANPTGTHWYHSHSGSQRNDGVYGALVVREAESVVGVVKDIIGMDFVDTPFAHTLLFQDFQSDDAADIILLSAGGNTSHFYGTSDPPDPAHYSLPRETVTTDGTRVGQLSFWSGLINGKGRHHSVNYNKTRLSIFTVSPGQTYRFRLIGAQHLFAFMISIDGHKLSVIAKDGVFVKPVVVDYLVIQPGERYDVLLETDASPDNDNFMIRAETLEASNEEPYFLSRENFAEAILHYDVSSEPLSTEYYDIIMDSLPVNSSCTVDDNCVVMNCPFKDFPPSHNLSCINVHQLELLTPRPAADNQSVPDQTLFFNFGLDGIGRSGSVNARSNVLPTSPLSLLNTTQLNRLANEQYCNNWTDSSLCDYTDDDSVSPEQCICSAVRSIPAINSSVLLVLSALPPSGSHDLASRDMVSISVHLHGYHFQIIDTQYGNYSSTGQLLSANQDIVCKGDNRCTVPHWGDGRGYKGGVALVNAPMADTVTVPAGGYVVVHLHANNPGHWYLHCTSEIYHVRGMGVVLSVGGASDMPTPPKEMSLCGNFQWTAEEYYDKLMGVAQDESPVDECSQVYFYVSLWLGVMVLCLLVSIGVTIGVCVYGRCVGESSEKVSKSYVHFEEDVELTDVSKTAEDHEQLIN